MVALPTDIGNLRNLTALTLEGYVQGLPLSFYNLTSLTSITLQSVFPISSFLPDLANLVELEALSIITSQFAGTLPPFRLFPKLRQVILSAISITEIPDLTGALALEYLSLSNLPLLRNFPAVGPEGTPNLRGLEIFAVPGPFIMPLVNVSKLESLILSSSGVNTTIPASVFTASLKTLHLDSLGLYPPGPVSSSISVAINLTTLYLRSVAVSGTLLAPSGGFPMLKDCTISLTSISSLSNQFANSAIETLYVFQ